MIVTVVAITLYITYYFASKPFLRKLSSNAARSGLPMLSMGTIAERQAFFQMSLVVGAHLVVAATLIIMVLPLSWWHRQADQLAIQVGLVPLAVLLGVGESVASGVLAECVYGLLRLIDIHRIERGRRSRLAAEAVEASAGGWMKTIRLAMKVNLCAGTILLILQLACEEIIFRFLLPRCLPGQMWTAGLLFVVMQFSGLKRQIGGVFAAVGACVMAASQGYLAAQTDFLLPLVVAHTVMFLSSWTLTSK